MTICRQCVIRIAGASGRGTVTSDSLNTPERDTSDSRAPSVEADSAVPEKLIPDGEPPYISLKRWCLG